MKRNKIIHEQIGRLNVPTICILLILLMFSKPKDIGNENVNMDQKKYWGD